MQLLELKSVEFDTVAFWVSFRNRISCVFFRFSSFCQNLRLNVWPTDLLSVFSCSSPMTRSFPSFLLMCTTCFRFRRRQHLLGLDLPVAIQLYTLPLHITCKCMTECERECVCVCLYECIAVDVCPSFARFVGFI